MAEATTRHEWLALSPDEFEEYVAELWEAQGYVTELTQSSHDYGVDVFAHPNDREEIEVIQAKRNKPGNKVGGPTIQQIIGAREQYDADSAIVITTSSFTSNAKTVATAADVELINGEKLQTLHRKYLSDGSDELEQGRFQFPEKVERIAFWLAVVYWGVVGIYIFYRWGLALL